MQPEHNRNTATHGLMEIASTQLGGQSIETVNARDLHAFLEVGKRFTTWLQDRIDQYGFIEETDFLPILGKSSGGRPSTEYHLSLDMAKELSMVERNEKGKQARQYFIDCERRSKDLSSALPDFSDPVVAARAWADAKESDIKALAAAEAARPAVEFVERYVSADSGNKGFRQVAKLLNANEREFREFLRDQRVMYRLGGEWMPYQNHVDAGRFVVKTGVAENEHAFNTAKFTAKGVNWVAGLWTHRDMQGAA